MQMEKKARFVVTSSIYILLFFAFFSGCLKNPSESSTDYSTIPELLLDYNPDKDCYKFYIMSAVGDYKFDYIEIIINETKHIQENNTYVLMYDCLSPEFDFYVEAQVDIDTIYYYRASVEISEDEFGEIVITIKEELETSEKEIILGIDDLPWKKILVRKS